MLLVILGVSDDGFERVDFLVRQFDVHGLTSLSSSSNMRRAAAASARVMLLSSRATPRETYLPLSDTVSIERRPRSSCSWGCWIWTVMLVRATADRGAKSR